MMVCVTSGRVSSIYSALRSVQQVASVVTGKAVMLSFHAKGGLQTLLGEAGRPKKHVQNVAATYHRFQETIQATQRRSTPDGTIPRPAGLGEAGRPHLAAFRVPPWHGS